MMKERRVRSSLARWFQNSTTDVRACRFLCSFPSFREIERSSIPRNAHTHTIGERGREGGEIYGGNDNNYYNNNRREMKERRAPWLIPPPLPPPSPTGAPA